MLRKMLNGKSLEGRDARLHLSLLPENVPGHLVVLFVCLFISQDMKELVLLKNDFQSMVCTQKSLCIRLYCFDRHTFLCH